tara:strand:+ start:601 stop:780 length:180 start_codon:yes stop_codon:yes gene_type:complete
MLNDKEEKRKKKEKLLKESYSLVSTLSTFPVPDSYGNKYWQQDIDSLRHRLAEVLNICE